MINLNVNVTNNNTKNYVVRKLYSMLLGNIDIDSNIQSQFSTVEYFISGKLIDINSSKDEYLYIKRHPLMGGITITISIKHKICSVYFTPEEHKILVKRVKCKYDTLKAEWENRKDRKINELKKENEDLRNKLEKNIEYCTHKIKNQSTLIKDSNAIKCKNCRKEFEEKNI